MTKKDQAIIAAHPESANNPHDLLTLHGLSENGYNELVAIRDAEANKSQAYKPVLAPSNILQPQIPVLSSVSPRGAGRVRVIPPSGGIGTEMSVSQAEQLVLKNPKYKIVR